MTNDYFYFDKIEKKLKMIDDKIVY